MYQYFTISCKILFHSNIKRGILDRGNNFHYFRVCWLHYYMVWFPELLKIHGPQAGEEILTEFTSRYKITDLLINIIIHPMTLFGDSCLKAYDDHKDGEAQFRIRRKYFLLMGRNGKA